MAGPFGKSVVQNPTRQGKPATVIFLHGLGDTGAGIAAIGQALRSSTVPNIDHVKCAPDLYCHNSICLETVILLSNFIRCK